MDRKVRSERSSVIYTFDTFHFFPRKLKRRLRVETFKNLLILVLIFSELIKAIKADFRFDFGAL